MLEPDTVDGRGGGGGGSGGGGGGGGALGFKKTGVRAGD